MANESKTTTEHKTIRAWSEARGGKPATVKSTERDGEAGILRIDFPGYSGGGSLEEISWEEFFKKFDEKNLAFLYQEHTSGGEESRFFKLVSREAPHTPKTEHKSDEKAHKFEQKEEGKSSAKVEHKDDTKAIKTHRDGEKPHKATKK